MQSISESEHESLIVVYDPADGHIVHSHSHYYVTLPSGQRPDEKALEKEVLEIVSRHGTASSKMALLHVDPRSLKSDTLYKVDTQKRQLVEIPKPERRKR